MGGDAAWQPSKDARARARKGQREAEAEQREARAEQSRSGMDEGRTDDGQKGSRYQGQGQVVDGVLTACRWVDGWSWSRRTPARGRPATAA